MKTHSRGFITISLKKDGSIARKSTGREIKIRFTGESLCQRAGMLAGYCKPNIICNDRLVTCLHCRSLMNEEEFRQNEHNTISIVNKKWKLVTNIEDVEVKNDNINRNQAKGG